MPEVTEQNASDDESLDVSERIPDDFPASKPAPFSLGGVQSKLNLVKGSDSMFYLKGSEPSHRLERYRECLKEIEWAVDLLAMKLPKPKYQALERDVILKMLGVNLVRDRDLTQLEAVWVLRRVASRTSWPIQRTQNL